MNVLVCLRMTPRTAPTLLDGADTRALARAAGLRAAGHALTAVYSSPAAEADAVAAALAPHVDRAVRVGGDDLATADFHTVGQVLATAIRRIGADLVLAPVQGDDEPLSAAPAALARHLGARYLPLVEEVAALDERGAEVVLRTAGVKLRLRATLPAVLATAPTSASLPESQGAGSAVAAETMVITDPDATVVRRRTELLGRAEPASRGSQTVASAAELVAALTRR